jgi:hypothetical protein
MYGNKLDELRSRINFKGEAWDRILLLEHAKKEKIRASDKEVVDWVTKQEAFHKDGKFNKTYYDMYIERALRSTPRQFEEEIRQMLTLAKIQDKIKANLELSDDKLKELYREERTEKDLLYAVLPKDSFEASSQVTDGEIKQLYDLVKDKLTSPEDGHPLSFEESKEEVRKKVTSGKAAELAVKKLNEIKTRIKNPADFESVLKEEKLEVVPHEKYRKGTYPAGIWPSDGLEKSVAKLGENEISDVFEVPKGAMIAKVAKVHPFDEKKFEEEKKAFKDQIAVNRSQEGLQKLLEQLRGRLSINLELMKEIFPAEETK